MLLLTANAQLALKHPDQARETLTKLVALEPRAVAVRRELASVEVQAGDYEAARNLIKDGMRETPDVYQLYLDYALIDLKASGFARRADDGGPVAPGDLGFSDLAALKGDLYMAAQKPDEAAKAYAEAAQTAPSNGLTERLAAAYVRAGKPDRG